SMSLASVEVEEAISMKRLKLMTLFALIVSVGLMIGCYGRPNPENNVSTALKEANLNNVDVDWDNDAKVIHLKGTVSTPADRTRAEELAVAAVGTAGKVSNELTIEGMNERTADNMDGEIRDLLDKAIHNDPMLKDRDINFDVNNGAVTIKGEVRTAQEKTKAGELARAAPGVKDVTNALEIKPSK
ncbi:MAG: BON domain-containing protein, partial [Acidimicrobiia bacterium]